MYAEKHYFQNRTTRWLYRASLALGLWQLIALLGAETGQPWIPLGYAIHLFALVFALLALIAFRNAGLQIVVSSRGWAIRRTPLQWHIRHISWQIKTLRLLKPAEFPEKQDGRFARSFMISNPGFQVLCIELTGGYQVFVSIQKPEELIEFLHHRLLQPDLKKKVLA